MISWRLIVVPLIIVGVLAAALALTPLVSTQSVLAAPPAQEPGGAPVAVVEIVPVAANAAADPNVITATLKYITDTAVGEAKATVAMGATGLANVPINVPVHVKCSPADKTVKGVAKWTLRKPADSKAAIADPAAEVTEFTPDLVGWYQAACVITTDQFPNGGEMEAVQLHAGMYIGFTEGKCGDCHKEAAEWLKTGHAKILSDEIDNKRTPDVPTHYSESCTRCHATGWYIAPFNGSGGFEDAKTAANWSFPTFKEIDAAGKDPAASNFDKMPASVKNMANIQCENCHGPAAEHVKDGLNVMRASQDEGVCNVCHNGGGHHIKGTELKNAKHSDADSAAFNTPVGPAEQACVRCHSGDGYASFLKDPTNQAAWKNNKQTIVCSTCHDPHSDANAFQLRIAGKPIALPFEAKDVGLSATCFECHNSRADPKNAVNSSFPHYNSIAEFISDTGGVTYGQTVANSPHGLLVGVAPVPNPAAKEDPEAPKFLFSKAGDEKGNTPGPCVTCHMYPGPEDSKDPNFHKVGAHSFNTVSPDGTFNYTAACQTCHQNITDTFNIAAKADYDGNGKVEGVQTEVKGLLDVLFTELAAKGLKKVDTGYPYATLPKGADGKTDDKIDNAWYNFRTVYGVMWGADTGNGNEGKAQAIHNFKRAVQLLQLSYKDLTGNDVPGATLMK